MANEQKRPCACCQNGDGCEETERTSNHEGTRRTFLGVVVGVINVGLVAVFGGPVLGFLGSPLKHKAKREWVSVTELNSLPEGAAKEVTYSLKVQDGYHVVDRNYSVYLRRSGEDVICFDPACTHLGCRVEYQASKDRFLCPCHGGVFDKDGQVVSGPPPKPLERHQLKVESGQVWLLREV